MTAERIPFEYTIGKRHGAKEQWVINVVKSSRQRIYRLKRRQCKRCGNTFKSRGHYAWFCPDCLEDREREWQATNRGRHPETIRANDHRRRARKLAAEGSFTHEQIKVIAEKQNNRCYYCGKLFYQSFKPQDYRHIEHKTPLSRGGSNSIDNIVLACAECNMRKHIQTHEEFLNRQLFKT